MKKIISLLMVLVLCFSTVSLSVGATQPEENQEESAGVSIPILNNFSTVFEFLKSGLNDMTVHLVPIENSTVNEFHIKYTQNDGEVIDRSIHTYYDSKSGEVFGGHYDQGVFDSGFGYNAHSQTFYAMNGCWQRQFGFTPMYDIAAKTIGFDYITRRIFFKYDGQDWMIQVWKGNYAWNLLVGAEIGIYNRPEGTVNGLFFNCAEDSDMMPMTMKLYDSTEVYIDRTEINTWWMTGFKLSDGKKEPGSLTLESEIEFPNEEMCKAFIKGTKLYPDIKCTTDGTTVSLKW